MSKIAIDCRMFSSKFTGIGKYTQELITNISKQDTKNTYYLLFNTEEFNNFKLPGKNFHKLEVNCPIYSLKEQFKLALVLYQLNVDLVHFTHFNASVFYLKKQILTIHDLTQQFYKNETNPIKYLLYKIVLMFNLLKAKQIITVSNSTKKDLNTEYKFTTKKSQTIYLGVDEHFNQNITDQLKLPGNYILYTGNRKKHKNLQNLFKAFSILQNEYKYEGSLIITGTLDPTLKIKDLIQIGFVPDENLPELYKKATVYVFPSFIEGFGIPILEAFACQTPTAVSNTGSLPEIGQDAVLTFNPNDPQDIAHKIYTIISNEPTKQKLIAKGNERLKEFSFQKMATQTLKLYKSCSTNFKI
jgi:glycosyltransferase involved in cell wall biosynthesis